MYSKIYSNANGKKFLLFDISHDLKIVKENQVIFSHSLSGPNDNTTKEELRKIAVRILNLNIQDEEAKFLKVIDELMELQYLVQKDFTAYALVAYLYFHDCLGKENLMDAFVLKLDEYYKKMFKELMDVVQSKSSDSLTYNKARMHDILITARKFFNNCFIVGSLDEPRVCISIKLLVALWFFT